MKCLARFSGLLFFSGDCGSGKVNWAILGYDLGSWYLKPNKGEHTGY
jgi:hypothetical protein